MKRRNIFATSIGGIPLLAVASWWFGFTSSEAIKEGADEHRPTKGLLREYKEVMLSKASYIEGQQVNLRRLENEQRSTESELAVVNRDLADSSEKLGFMLGTLKKEGTLVSMGNVSLKRSDIEKDIEKAAQHHRRLESRSESLKARTALVTRQLKALESLVSHQRIELGDMKSKYETWQVALSSATSSKTFDPETIEGELLKSRERSNQLGTEMERRLPVHELPAPDLAQRNWSRWKEGSTVGSSFWIAEAESIVKGGQFSDQQGEFVSASDNR